jgi:hypothetical protein
VRRDFNAWGWNSFDSGETVNGLLGRFEKRSVTERT